MSNQPSLRQGGTPPLIKQQRSYSPNPTKTLPSTLLTSSTTQPKFEVLKVSESMPNHDFEESNDELDSTSGTLTTPNMIYFQSTTQPRLEHSQTAPNLLNTLTNVSASADMRKSTLTTESRKNSIPSASLQHSVPPNSPSGENSSKTSLLSPPDLEHHKEGHKESVGSRFQLVKIETKEPFKRGRWRCMDFNDPPELVKASPPGVSAEVQLTPAHAQDLVVTSPPSTASSGPASGAIQFVVGVTPENREHDRWDMQVPFPAQSQLHIAAANVSTHSVTPPVPIQTANTPSTATFTRNLAASLSRALGPEVVSAAGSSPTSQVFFNSPSSGPLPTPNTPTPKGSIGSIGSLSGLSQLTVNPMFGSTPPTGSLLSDLVAGAVAPSASPNPGNLISMIGARASTGSEDFGPTGSNVVAIDNKIEQAMDLVKTHLMYAVREEVELLREKIGELEKKVYRLEWENKLLRDHATPEVLVKLSTTAVAPPSSQQSAMPPTSATVPHLPAGNNPGTH